MFFQAQLVVLSTQIAWSENIESALTNASAGGDMTPMQGVLSNVEASLNLLADTVLMEQPPLRRKKLEHLVKGTGTNGPDCEKFSSQTKIAFFLLLRSQSSCTSAT